jgi:hypothetical protein
MPFGEYESMDDCKRENSDKNDPGAYCAQIHKNITGEWPGQSKAADWYDRPERYVKHALDAMESLGYSPTEDRLAEVRRTERKIIDKGQ